ncbi:hypothetical protein [Helicobacter japonicus]|uniref:hypothetical protein n=1 Tax=Helicobacter japonicus TaxID=425400 RepID=UPI0026039C83|nr:hypothetical protein [Helicobacter japonicus]
MLYLSILKNKIVLINLFIVREYYKNIHCYTLVVYAKKILLGFGDGDMMIFARSKTE